MGIVIPVGGFQATLRWTLTGDPEEMVSTLGIDNVAILTPTVMAETIRDMLVASSRLCAAANFLNDYTFVGVTVQNMTTTGILSGEHVEPVVGTDASAGLPSNCSWLIHKRTAAGGRTGRGRFYAPAFSLAEGNISESGTISGGTFTATQALWNSFYSDLVAAGLPPLLFHESGAAGTPILSFDLDTRIATQRRRMR